MEDGDAAVETVVEELEASVADLESEALAPNSSLATVSNAFETLLSIGEAVIGGIGSELASDIGRKFDRNDVLVDAIQNASLAIIQRKDLLPGAEVEKRLATHVRRLKFEADKRFSFQKLDTVLEMLLERSRC